MENKKNKVRLDESRVYEENGVIKVRHVINESTDVDMTPLPTESRIFVKGDKVITVCSEEINKTGPVSVETALQLSLEHMEKRHTIK